MYAYVTSTKSAGGNNLINQAGYFSASGGDVNRAILTDDGDVILNFSSGTTTIKGEVGFNGTAPIAQPTVTGSRATGAALVSLLSALASYGLIIDSSTT